MADLRATSSRRPGDAEITRLIDDLVSVSDEFARLWAQQEVAVRRQSRKGIVHPVVGLLELDCEVLVIPDRDQRLVLDTAPPGTETAERLDLLRVVGLRDLSPRRTA